MDNKKFNDLIDTLIYIYKASHKDIKKNEFIKWFIQDIDDLDIDKKYKDNIDDIAEDIFKQIEENERKTVSESIVVPAATLAAATVAVVPIVNKKNTDLVYGLAYAQANTKDPEKKSKLQRLYLDALAMRYNEKGEKRLVSSYTSLSPSAKERMLSLQKHPFNDDLIKLGKKVKKEYPDVDLKKDAITANKIMNYERQYERTGKLPTDLEISKSKNSEKDKDVKKDEDGNILKQEEVKDPKTGEKKKVITHTGPRGGKFYYPEGKPKTDEHKVYVQESLMDYLLRNIE